MVIKIDWVLQNELAIGQAPRTQEDINELKKNGIISILSLCSKEEVLSDFDIEEFFLVKRVVLPDHKYKVAPTITNLNMALTKLSEIITIGPVYVHCVAGIERSPLVCMAWLIKNHNLTPIQALDYLMEVHNGTNPLPEQLSLLKLL